MVSACLIGDPVRYDGAHKRNPFITEQLASAVEIIRVCPEVEAGFGTPREPIELLNSAGDVRVHTVHSKRDVTDSLSQFANKWLSATKSTNVDGFVLKRGSPSCGVANVKVRQSNGEVARAGEGLFAAAVKSAFPHWAIVSEDQLNNPLTRFCFLSRVFSSHRLRSFFCRRLSAEEVAKVHAREKMLALAFSERHFHRLNDLVANLKKYLADDFAKAYQRHFRAALSQRPTTDSMKKAAQLLADSIGEKFNLSVPSLFAKSDNTADMLLAHSTLKSHLQSVAETHHKPCITQHTLLSPFPNSLAETFDCSLGSVKRESQEGSRNTG